VRGTGLASSLNSTPPALPGLAAAGAAPPGVRHRPRRRPANLTRMGEGRNVVGELPLGEIAVLHRR
jgi:hypothetical protein